MVFHAVKITAFESLGCGGFSGLCRLIVIQTALTTTMSAFKPTQAWLAQRAFEAKTCR